MGAMIGRARELTTLRTAVGRCAAGECRTILLEGDAGIGKTTLLDALAQLATGAGISVLRGGADEIEMDRPFGPLIAALGLAARATDPRRRAIAGLLAGHRPSTGGLDATVPAARYQAIDAVCALVEETAGLTPTALLLDDLHWADESTVRVVRRLSRVSGIPLLVGVTSRPPEPGSLLGEVVERLEAAGATRLTVSPLARREAQTLVADLVGGPLGPRLGALAEGAAGNPLMLSELVAGLREDGSLIVGESTVELAEGAGTGDLARRLRTRAARLSPAAAALMRVGAVLAMSFTLEEAARTGGWSVADLVEPLDELIRAGLLTDENGRLAFRHDLVRRAIEEELPPTARSALHRAAAHALAENGASTVRVARHLALGADEADREAVVWLHRAAREAAARAPASAVALLDEALALTQPDDPLRLTLLAERVEALGWSGRNAEAEALARGLIDEIEDRPTRVALRRQLALALFISNRTPEAAVECARSADECFDDPPRRAVALAECALSHIGTAMPGSQVAGAYVEEALALASAHDVPVAISLALCVRSRLLAFSGKYEESLEAARGAVEQVGRSPAGEVGRYQPGIFVMFTLCDLDRFDEAFQMLERERKTAEEQGIVWALPLHHAVAATAHLFSGNLHDCMAEAQSGLAIAEDSDALLPVAWLHALVAQVALHRGELAVAAAHVAQGYEAMARTTPLLGTDMVAVAQVRLAEARDGLTAGAVAAVAAFDLFAALGVRGGMRLAGLEAMRLAKRAGDSEAAERIADALRESALLSHAPSDRALTLYADAVLADNPDMLLEAASCLEPGVHPLMRTRIAEEAIQRLWSAGRADEATQLLADVRAAWAAAGAIADERRAAALYATLGLRRPPTAKPRTGWDALTATERQIVELVATGAMNTDIAARLGISRRTVETHMRHIYDKIAVSTRVELVLKALEYTADAEGPS